jgi:hypothetical protein
MSSIPREARQTGLKAGRNRDSEPTPSARGARDQLLWIENAYRCDLFITSAAV